MGRKFVEWLVTPKRN